MINFKKICRILLLAAFVCTLSGVRYVKAEFGFGNGNYLYNNEKNNVPEYDSEEKCKETCTGEGERCVILMVNTKNSPQKFVCQHYGETTNNPEKPVTPAGGNVRQIGRAHV